MDDVWTDFMEHMVVRVTGPMKFRLLLQRGAALKQGR